MNDKMTASEQLDVAHKALNRALFEEIAASERLHAAHKALAQAVFDVRCAHDRIMKESKGDNDESDTSGDGVDGEQQVLREAQEIKVV